MIDRMLANGDEEGPVCVAPDQAGDRGVQAAPKRAASQADDDTAKGLGEGGRLFFGFKVYADQGLGLVQPISECCGVGVLRVHPPAHPSNKVSEVFFGEPSLYGVKHSHITLAQHFFRVRISSV